MAAAPNPFKHPRRLADGFSFLIRGARELRQMPGAWWLMGVPVLINLALFAGLIVFLINSTPTLIGWFTIGGSWMGWRVLAWMGTVLVYGAMAMVYAFLFSIIAEVLGAPFYEEIGVRVDKRHGAAIVERPWYQEVWLAVTQELLKLVVLLGIGFVALLLQFIPVIGQMIGAVAGVVILVLTLGMDAVDAPLARRGLLFPDRGRWVMRHVVVVCGLGTAKAIGLIVPILNIVVLPIAAVGGTLLVQKYDGDSNNH